MTKFYISILALLLLSFSSFSQSQKKKIIFSDTFEKGLSYWTIEQAAEGTAEISNGKLEINDKNGCTVWLNQKMKGNFRIAFDVIMVDEGGINDHVRDLNFFFKAIDPSNPADILANAKKRNGIFSRYDSLRTYYIGYGGNHNTSTRFRKYPGDGTRPLLPEHDLNDKKYLNVPNLKRHVEIVCSNNKIIFTIDKLTVFDITDQEAFSEGWFGFRTVDNHMIIDDFYVYSF